MLRVTTFGGLSSLDDLWMTPHCPLLPGLQMRTPGLVSVFSLGVTCAFFQQARNFSLAGLCHPPRRLRGPVR